MATSGGQASGRGKSGGSFGAGGHHVKDKIHKPKKGKADKMARAGKGKSSIGKKGAGKFAQGVAQKKPKKAKERVGKGTL
jgi:hypothetical protein